jgi:hypothetical protein
VGSDHNKIPLELIVNEWDQIINNLLMLIKNKDEMGEKSSSPPRGVP